MAETITPLPEAPLSLSASPADLYAESNMHAANAAMFRDEAAAAPDDVSHTLSQARANIARALSDKANGAGIAAHEERVIEGMRAGGIEPTTDTGVGVTRKAHLFSDLAANVTDDRPVSIREAIMRAKGQSVIRPAQVASPLTEAAPKLSPRSYARVDVGHAAARDIETSPGSTKVSEDNDPTAQLGEAFADDPFAVLAQESRALYEVFHSSALNETEKDARLENYFHMIESLDRSTFADKHGEVASGVPQDYIPDSFIDMGPVDSLTPNERYGRPMNYVDTYNTLHQHKQLFEYVFTNVDPATFSGPDGDILYQQTVLTNIAREIAESMPYGEPTPAERGGILPISSSIPAKCQQHALTAQVLAQAFGIQSRLSKNFVAYQPQLEEHGHGVAGGDHVSNIVKIRDRTYMFDTTNPQVNRQGNWLFGLFRMERQLPDGSWLVNEQAGGQRKYKEHQNMHWTIRRQD